MTGPFFISQPYRRYENVTQEVIENTEPDPVLDLLNTIRAEVGHLHNRLGYLERTSAAQPVSQELQELRQLFKGMESKLDLTATANMTEEEQLAYWKTKAQEKEQEKPAEPAPQEPLETSPAFLTDYYQKYAEPDILDAAFEEGLISTNRADLVTDEDKRVLAAHAPRETIAPSLDGIQAYKRRYIRNLKQAAEKSTERPRAVQTTRPIAQAEKGKLRPVDLRNMTPDQVAASKEQLFAQLGI